MKNYAVIDDGLVVNVVLADEEWASSQELDVVEYTEENPAFIGGDYVDGFFYRPKPYESWVRIEGIWAPPIPMPDDIEPGHAWIWNETNVNWEKFEIPAIELPPADSDEGGE